MTTPNCLINQSPCGRIADNPVCPKCGMDERVVYPGQADLETALDSARGRYRATCEREEMERRKAEEARRQAEQERKERERRKAQEAQAEREAIAKQRAAQEQREREDMERSKAEEARRQAEKERIERERERERERRVAQEAKDRSEALAKQRAAQEQRIAQAAQAQREADQVFRDAPWAPEMVVLPSGCFLMGSADDDTEGLANERPQHRVEIGYRFGLGKYPVTFEEWEIYASEVNRAYKPSDEGWGRGQRPVINVSWDDAQAYILWLNRKLGLADDDLGRYRLPSEAEWEYACRAGTTGLYNTPDGLLSDAWAVYDARLTCKGVPKPGSRADRTTPVGTFPANAWGLHDMHGNVLEWIQDAYCDDYCSPPMDHLFWKMNASRRVIRGGSWNYPPQHLRSAFRYGAYPDFRNYGFGFRLAKTVTEGAQAA